jgi:ABC-type Fe3+-hydroxamate transport system substrate-binding protein
MSRGCPIDDDETQYSRHHYPAEPVLKAELTLQQIRELGKAVRKEEFTSVQAQAFITLYQRELNELLNQTVRDFIEKKVGK